jgi:hypothetical protein
MESKLSTRDTQHTSALQQALVLDRVLDAGPENDFQLSGSSYVWRRNARSSSVDKMPSQARQSPPVKPTYETIYTESVLFLSSMRWRLNVVRYAGEERSFPLRAQLDRFLGQVARA